MTNISIGHETTSGLLSFTFLELLRNPETLRTAQEEVDDVIGKGPITVDHLSKLKYINAALRESLRLHPTVPTFVRQVRPDLPGELSTVGGGKYLLEKKTSIVLLLSKAQQDPAVYGEDATEFKPERMLDENFEQLPQAAWKVWNLYLEPFERTNSFSAIRNWMTHCTSCA